VDVLGAEPDRRGVDHSQRRSSRRPRGLIVKKAFRHEPDRMISGKLRKKRAGRGGAKESTITVDGTGYVWSFRHGWQVHGKDLTVVSISVSLEPGRTRELILDFQFKVPPPATRPSEAELHVAILSGIRAARESGWDPESRGRAVRRGA
jgi:hypothetical protein